MIPEAVDASGTRCLDLVPPSSGRRFKVLAFWGLIKIWGCYRVYTLGFKVQGVEVRVQSARFGVKRVQLRLRVRGHEHLQPKKALR